MSTIKLFDTDSYIREFTATVLSCSITDKGYDLVLDRTAFFPEEGGQSCDRGYILYDSHEIIINHVLSADSTIHHFISSELPEGASVTGFIDWDFRFSNMQQHSGEHLLSGYVNRHYGYDNVGFHLSPNEVTVDFNGTFSNEQIRNMELDINRLIMENVRSRIIFPSKDELALINYRSKKEIPGQVRIVSFGEYDICACCAPHVSTTAEIGIFKIISAEHFRGGTRMNILCGYRALLDYVNKQDSCSGISVLLSAKPNEVLAAVTRLKESSDINKFKLIKLQSELISEKLNLLDKSDTNPVLFVDGFDTPVIRNGVKSMVNSFSGYSCIFSGNDDEGYSFVIGSEDSDCNILLNKLKTMQAQGGGKPSMITGTIKGCTRDTLRALIKDC